MGVGDLCYKSGGSLAYSKSGSALIYKGTWRAEVEWDGSYSDRFDSNYLYGDYSSKVSDSSTLSWRDDSDIGTNMSYISRYAGPIWVRYLWPTSLSGMSIYTYDPGAQTPPYYLMEFSADYVLLFLVTNWGSYGGGYPVRGFGSSSPSGSFSLLDTNPNLSGVTIASPVITTSWI